ncbi:hypothetical protein NM208_g16200 [Fusarium decemcellulare]|uniref:Uncharacterized protein n=1 Tax=Fusarium decemcellulare TaxID=57161 RepID=A0ACC1REA2_9HYPO|nr:hypothetical protein NM208_g16200 [Fusarium decemcellulare]
MPPDPDAVGGDLVVSAASSSSARWRYAFRFLPARKRMGPGAASPAGIQAKLQQPDDQLSIFTPVKPDKMTKRVYFVVHGRVQGVGFRYFTQKKAQEYGVTGWCRNTHDKKVEGEAQGTDEILTKFFKDVDNGPSHARVTQVTQEERGILEDDDRFIVTR